MRGQGTMNLHALLTTRVSQDCFSGLFLRIVSQDCFSGLIVVVRYTNGLKQASKNIKGGQEMTISGKLELTVKINELPEAETVENGWKSFKIDCDGRTISITVRPKIWKKLEDAQANYPMWVAAIAGKMGPPKEKGFELLEANIQVFEKKPKEASVAG
jgi:hypothetical protein